MVMTAKCKGELDQKNQFDTLSIMMLLTFIFTLFVSVLWRPIWYRSPLARVLEWEILGKGLGRDGWHLFLHFSKPCP